MHFYDNKCLFAFGFALVNCVGVNERENPKSGMKMLQSNIYYYYYYYYYVRIKRYIVHAQDSYACTSFLCMHNTLVHALEGPGTKAGTQQKALGVRPGPWLTPQPRPKPVQPRTLCGPRSEEDSKIP